MQTIQDSLRVVREELSRVGQDLHSCAKNGEKEESPAVRFLLSERERLERKEERLEKEHAERLERLEKEINEKGEHLRTLLLQGKGEDDPLVKYAKEEKIRVQEEKKELQRQAAVFWTSRSGTDMIGSQKEESLLRIGAELSKQGAELGKQGEVQAEMLQLLQSRQMLKANISQPDSVIQGALLRSCGLASFVEGEAAMSESRGVVFRPFDWPQGDEEKDSAYACEHCKEELERFGVKFGRGGWKLLDVRNDNRFLSTQVGNIALGGTTDAVIVPYKVARDGASMQIRVVLEWKIPRYSEWALCKGQGLAEFIAAYAHSNGPVIVVVTDLQSRFHILEPSLGEAGNPCITEFLNMSASQAMEKIAGFLATVSPLPDYMLDRDAGAAESAYARVSKRIKETIPENPLAQILALADFLPPCEREQLVWEAFGSQHLRSRDSEVPPTMYM